MIRFLLKNIVIIVLVLAVLALLAALGVTAGLNSMVKAGIETVGSYVVKVPLEVRRVDVSLLGGSLALDGFRVGNPEGFKSEYAFSADGIRAEAELRSLLTDEVVIPLIEVDEPHVTLELSGGRTNFGQILEGMRKPDEEEPEGARKALRIGELTIRRAKLSVGGLPLGQSLDLTLPDIVLRDLQAGGDASPAEVAARIIAELYAAVIRAVEEKAPGLDLGDLTAQAEQALQSGREAVEEGRQTIQETADELKKGLEDIFK